MKRSTLIFISTCGLILLVFAVLMSLPSDNYPPETTEAIAASKNRYVDLRNRSRNPETNGQIDPYFFKYWDDQESSSELATSIKIMAGYCDYREETRVDHRALQARKDPDYLKARANFEAILPKMLAAMSKPDFLRPLKRKSGNIDLFLGRNLDKTVGALVAYCQALSAEGQQVEASRILLLGLSLSGKIRADSTWMTFSRSRTMNGQLYLAYLQLLPPETKLNSDQWSEISKQIASAIPGQEFFRIYLEEMISGQALELENYRKGRTPSSQVSLPMAIFLGREERIFLHNCGRLLQAEKRGTLPQAVAHMNDRSVLKWLVGKNGAAFTAVFPNLLEQRDMIEYDRATLQLIQNMAALKAYQTAKGAYPTDFDQLEKSGYAVSRSPLITYSKGLLDLNFPPSFDPMHRGRLRPKGVSYCTKTKTGVQFKL